MAARQSPVQESNGAAGEVDIITPWTENTFAVTSRYYPTSNTSFNLRLVPP